LAREAAVGPEPDLNLRPSLTHMCHDARDLLFRASRGVDIGLPQLGNEQVSPVKDVKGQVTVAAVKAMVETAFLMAVQRIIRRIEIEHDALGRALVGSDIQVQKHLFHCRINYTDLVIAAHTAL